MAHSSNIGVLGLGKSGLPLALLLTAAHYTVISWDTDASVRVAVTERSIPFSDPAARSLLAREPLRVVRPEVIASECRIVFVCVPRIVDNGTQHIIEALQSIASGRANKVLAVICSTVEAGDFATTILPSAKRLGIRIAYWPLLCEPETVITDLQHPPVHIIGHEQDSSILQLWAVLRHLTPNVPIVEMSLPSAEIAKLAAGTLIALKANYATALARICEHRPGAQVMDVVEAIGRFPEIGSVGLNPAVGHRGTYLPNDVDAFYLLHPVLSETVNTLTNDHVGWTCGLVEAAGAKTFAVLGKSVVSDARGSFVTKLENELVLHGVTLAPIPEADAVIIVRALSHDLSAVIRTDALVIDMWRRHPYLGETHPRYIALGQA